MADYLSWLYKTVDIQATQEASAPASMVLA